MVFESIVVELINRYLGDFVENLDKSQLSIGIWGGDIVLKDLDLKESALDELDLPMKIKAGHIANLTLKIPWKNLYSEPVIASIDGLYALAIPNIGIKYNEEKEEKSKQDSKQKKLQQIEDAKKFDAEKDKPKEEKKDSFAEKFATQVIKNLQVQVNNVHVRFEDRFTDPKHPFSIGVTLQELSFRTTDENWNACVVKDAVTQIFKLVKLESLAMYWNSSSEMLDGVSKEEIMQTLKNNVITPTYKPSYQYLIRPISSVAHLRLNTKPESTNFSIPKVLLTIVFDDITVALAKLQYNDILQLLEGFERLNLLGIYRKYRPDVPLRGNPATWWHFAYKSVLEETVRRRRRMWSWEHISKHRQTMKKYREAYITKLDKKKVSSDLQKILDEGEKYLDVFSITIMRQQAEVEAAKRGAKRKEEGGGGWFGGLFGGKKKKEAQKSNEIQTQFADAYSEDERAKLYAAIGYQENEGDVSLPKEYVAMRIVTKLNTVSLAFRDDSKKDGQIMKVQLTDVFTSFAQRPAANAIKVEGKMDKMTVFGSPQSGIVPKMVLSQVKEADKVFSLLDLLFETNPLDGECDTRVRVNARPVEIIYDAITINALAEFFKPPEEVFLKQLSQAAMAKFEEIKEQSATGLQYAIEQRKFTEISVDLKPSCVIVPYQGFYKKDVAVIILDLGNLKVNSEKNKSQSPKERMETVEEVMLRAYDKFNIQLNSIQVLYASAGEEWRGARRLDNSNLHILRPISINLCLQKCMFDKDPRMAKMKVFGELPLLSLGLSDFRLQEILNLVQSIPFPESPEVVETEDIFAGPSTLPTIETDVTSSSLKTVAKDPTTVKPSESKELTRTTSQEFVNATDMEIKFEIKKVELVLAQRINKVDVPVVKFMVERLGTAMKMRSFDMIVEAYLGCIYLQHLKMKDSEELQQQLINNKYLTATGEGPIINLINTPTNNDDNFKLLTVRYLKAKTDGPEFATSYANTEQSISVHFSALELLLHQGALLSLMELAQSLQPDTTPATKDPKTPTKQLTEKGKEKVEEVPVEVKPKREKKVKPKDPSIIDIQIKATLESFGVAICTSEKLVTDIKIKGIESSVSVQQSKTTIAAVVRDMIVFDPSPLSLYPRILSIEGSEVLKADIVAYNNGTEGDKYGDIKCVDTSVAVTIGCVRVTFLNKFVNELMGYMDNFQAAKDKLKEAGETMAEKSVEQAQNITASAARISLNVNMKAPLITVPQSSTSKNALLVDLGTLTLSNEFFLANAKSAEGKPAVLEKMKIELTALKLSRGLLGEKEALEGEVMLLEPMTLSLGLKRNLSAGWYKDAPEIDIAGSMAAVAVTISQGDLTVIMLLLNENLTEGQPAPGAKAVTAPPKPDDVTSPVKDGPVKDGPVKDGPVKDAPNKDSPLKKEVAGNVSAAPKSTAVTAVVAPSGVEKLYSKMKFAFNLDTVSATLFSGDSEMKKAGNDHTRERSLGKFELAGFLVKGEMMSDTSMDVKVILKDTSLEDTRPPKQNGVTSPIVKPRPFARMIQRSHSIAQETSVPSSANMIHVSFIQDKKQNKIIDVKLNSIHVCVCTEFLMSIADFFVKGMPPPKDTPAAPTTTVKKSPQKGKEKPKLAPPPESEMSITVSLGRPDIILIEDASSYSSNAIILETEMMFKMRQTPDATTMGGSIKDLQLYSCIFNKRESTKTQILPPCEINLHSNAPYGQGQHMDIQLTDMIINISPATIRTLTAIAGGLSAQPAETNGVKSSNIPTNLWGIRTLEESNFWFLNFPIEEGEDAVLMNGLESSGEFEVIEEVEKTRDEQEHKEVLLVAAPVIVVKLEGGVGKRTVPLLIVETGFQGEVRNWSSELSVESTLHLEVAYYNEDLAVWEPVLEPVHDNSKNRKWEIGVQVVQNSDDFEVEDEEVDMPILPPKMSLTVKSEDQMNMTLTKTCLDVLGKLGKAFTDAYYLVEPSVKPGEVISPYLIQNNTGLDLTIKLDNDFESTGKDASAQLTNGLDSKKTKSMPPEADSGRVHLPVGAEIPVFGRKHNVLVRKASIIKATQEGDEKKMLFQVEQFNATREVTIKRAEKRLFQINKKSDYPGDLWQILVSVQASYGRKTISLGSLVQVQNHLTIPVEVFYKGEKEEIKRIGEAEPGEYLPLPLPALYTFTSEIFFRPLDKKYKVSSEGVNWRNAVEKGLFQMSCDSQDGKSPFYMNVKAVPEKVFFEDSSEMSKECYTISVYPTVILHNLLPFPVTCMLESAVRRPDQTVADEIHLSKGENLALNQVSVNQTTVELRITYRGKEWFGHRKIESDIPELSIWQFNNKDSNGTVLETLDLGLHNKVGSGSLDISLYSPYWMINKTGMALGYKGNDTEVTLEHPADYDDIVLFSFKAKSLFSKKKEPKEKAGSEKKGNKVKEMKQAGKASLRVSDSEWSDKFSLDVVGSSGTVQCKTKTGSYECGVRIDMTSSGLSKIVTFSPFYMLVNTSETGISCSEVTDSAIWVDVSPGECLPFWPQQTGKEIKVKAKVKLSEEETTPFLINSAHTTLMKLDNQHGGLDIECHVTESSMVTTIGEYKTGCASVLLVNHSENLSIIFCQSGSKTTQTLGGKSAILYTWEDALGKRELAWACGDKKDIKNDLTKDGVGDIFYQPENKLYWMSFLDGPQRVLLFTEDMEVISKVEREAEYSLERIDQEINLSLRGMGLSLVNNNNQTEVAYMGITSSGIIWEEKKKRYKALNLKTLTVLETAYQKYLNELAVGKSPNPRMALENKMEVDFDRMEMIKPNKRGIRRSFVEGIWFQYKTSAHQLQLHAKLNRLQFDNQLAGAVFPTVLSPLPPPKSVAADSVPKPFTEFSLMLSKHEHSHMTQIKYCKVLIQEMALKVDQGFLNAVIQLFSANDPISREAETKLFEEDCKRNQLPLVEVVGVSLSQGKKNFYDHLHFSPIKVHLSFSLQGGSEDSDKPTAIHANVLNVFLQSVGVVLTDVQDVVFKLGYFERNHSFYNNSQLTSQMTSHYVSQAIKQMYVLVLGLDVLGNPFGLLRGLSEGVGDLFYEPYQGAIQGPEEFAEGLALGVRSLFGHAVGGAAGAASRITGTLGKGIAALTFDDDYQKKRRQQMNKRPANAKEGFARGGKGLIMGVVDGVTGIVKKPMEGAKQDGVGGFFKGMGKGLVGVVTRPTSGVIDFASTSLEGIKRIVEMSDEVRRLRPPRRFHKDFIVRPYIHTEAEGYAILQEIEKGQYTDDDYVAHAVVTKDGKNVLVVTDKRVIFASKGELLGQWNCEFTYTWFELKEPPKLISKGIEIVLKEKEKKKFPFGSSSAKKDILISDKKTAQWIVDKIHELMERVK